MDDKLVSFEAVKREEIKEGDYVEVEGVPYRVIRGFSTENVDGKIVFTAWLKFGCRAGYDVDALLVVTDSRCGQQVTLIQL